MGYDLTLTETLLSQLGESAPPVQKNAWEVGRLVLTHDRRSDVETLRRCLFLSLDYAYRNAPVDNLYASCTHVLARLYRRFGFGAVAGVTLAGTEKAYTLIHGSADRVLQSLTGESLAQ